MTSLQGSSVQSDLRIVIIGNAGDEKNKVVKSVLNCENPTGEKVGLCTLHQCEHEGRRIRVVEAPGWDRILIQRSAENIKEVERSVSLCPPGPHVFLLVIPVKISKGPSLSDIISAQMHIESLSERVWKHTIMLFACDEGVRDFNIQSYFQKAKNIQRHICKGKAYVLESRSKISELFTKIEDLVEENHGDVFLPQAYYELFQWKTGSLRFRRRSLQMDPLTSSSVQSDLRIVIIGNAGDAKNKVVKSVLNCENPTGVKVGLCTLHQREHEGRRIRVVEAPGWDQISIKRSAENIQEVHRSVSLCPPGPHVFLLVIPVKISEEPSLSDIISAQTHMELLSERVWKHTILLFDCDEGVSDFNIQSYFQKAKNILEKCEGKAYVLESRSKISELFTKIEELVEENRGDVFIPQSQAYSELIQQETESLRFRRRSLQINPPNMTKENPYLTALLLIGIICAMMMSIFRESLPGTELCLHDDLSLGVVVGAVIVLILVVILGVSVHLMYNKIKKK